MKKFIALAICAAVIMCAGAVCCKVTVSAEEGDTVDVTLRVVTKYSFYKNYVSGTIYINKCSDPDGLDAIDTIAYSMTRATGWTATAHLEPGYYQVIGFGFDNVWQLDGLCETQVFEVKGTKMTVYAELITNPDARVPMPDPWILYDEDPPDFYIWGPAGVWGYPYSQQNESSGVEESSDISEEVTGEEGSTPDNVSRDTGVIETSQSVSPGNNASSPVSQEESALEQTSSGALLGTYLFTGILLLIILIACVWLVVRRRQ